MGSEMCIRDRPTRGKFKGAIPRTSIASTLSRNIPGNLPVRLPTAVGFPGIGQGMRIRMTKSIGAFVGRSIPIIGWAVLGFDIGAILYKTQTEYNRIVK